MRIPRWTTYPAIALLLIMAMIGLPRGKKGGGAALRTRTQQAVATQIVEPEERGSQATERKQRELLEFLPADHVTDGSVDYREELQVAIDACAGSLLKLPGFPIQVGRAPGENYGVLIREGLSITGCTGAELRTQEQALQLMRGEDVNKLLLSSFALSGPGGDGQRLGHGLLQISGGEDVHLRDLSLRDADADGLAISQVENCSVEGVIVQGASKSAIYLNDCTDAFIRNNHVSDFGGHLLADGTRVGVGIQLSSNHNLLCADNVVQDGVGVGILCNAYSGGRAPIGNAIRDNHVRDVSNPENPNVSGGIRLANGATHKITRTNVTGNSIWNCGANGIYVENHGDSDVVSNLVSSSDRVGILVSSIEGVRITRNVILRSGAGHAEGDEPLAMINAAREVEFVGNVTDPQQIEVGTDGAQKH